MNNKNIPNAYDLNGEAQFCGKENKKLESILEGIEKLDGVMPGIKSGSTLLYAPEGTEILAMADGKVIAGPYSFWHHTHTFEEHDGQTIVGDHIEYIAPFGPLGKLLAIRRR